MNIKVQKLATTWQFVSTVHALTVFGTLVSVMLIRMTEWTRLCLFILLVFAEDIFWLVFMLKLTHGSWKLKVCLAGSFLVVSVIGVALLYMEYGLTEAFENMW